MEEISDTLKDSHLAALQAEVASIAAGNRPPMRTAIPIRIVENLQLSPVTPEAIRRRLQGAGTRTGDLVGLEWFLVEHDPSAALYEAACPYPFCDGKGTIMAATAVDSHGKAELPFTDPGALCCDVCDSEIERRYEEEAHRLANPRKPSVLTVENPKACQDCETLLPVGAPANTRLCQPCATARALERKRLSMAAKRSVC